MARRTRKTRSTPRSTAERINTGALTKRGSEWSSLRGVSDEKDFYHEGARYTKKLEIHPRAKRHQTSSCVSCLPGEIFPFSLCPTIHLLPGLLNHAATRPHFRPRRARSATLDDDLQAIWKKCVDKLGFVPNVFGTYSLKPKRLRNFMADVQRNHAGQVRPVEAGAGDGRRRRIVGKPLLLLSRRAWRRGALALRRSRTRRDDGAQLPRRQAGSASAGDAGFRLEDDHNAASGG